MSRRVRVAQLGWMAGVLETRGKIRRVDNPLRKTVQLILQVQSRHLDVVNRMCELTGVRSQPTAAKQIADQHRRGCVDHCPEPHFHVTPYLPAMNRWAVTGAGAAIVLHNLMPYLCMVGGMQAVVDEVIAALPAAGRGRPAVEASIARLRKLGWVIPPGLVPEQVKVEGEAGEVG